MTSPDDPPDDLVDRVSGLLAQVLESDPPSQPQVLESLCIAHPDCATSLRQGYGTLQQLHLIAVDAIGTAAHGQVATGLPRVLGPFRLLELLGAGGMGSVYRAEDLELKRPVALKLVRSELLASERTRRRFHRESEALARLDHPGLCTVYSAGSTDGQPWIAMRLLRGRPLAGEIAARAEARKANNASTGRRSGGSQTRDELARTLRIFEQAAQALATAHAAGVIHRDIKPANIVLDGGDEPVVIDFGLVHLEDAASHLTMSGDHIGTPAYMAPEQVTAGGREPGPATDVYALGVTLFEVLTLRSPYQAVGREELFQSIVRGDRRRLRQVDRTLPADLEVVLERALDVDPTRRYASMAEFAEDLARVRRHEPPTARRIGHALRLRRWCQRNPVASTTLLLLSLGLGSALLLNASRRAAQRHSLAMAYGNLAGQLVDENPEHALDLALRGLELAPGDPESLGLLLRALQEVHPHEVWSLPWPRTVTPQRVVPSPAGNAAVVLGGLADGGTSEPLLWRGGTPMPLPIEGGALDADWSPDGSLLLTTGQGSAPQLWSATGEPLGSMRPPDAPPQLRMPRGRFLDADHIVFSCRDGTARVLDRTNGSWLRLKPSLCEQQPGMPGLAVSGDRRRIALGDLDGRIVIHETADALRGREGRVLVPSGSRVFQLELGGTGALVQSFSLKDLECSLWTWAGERLHVWGSLAKPATPMPLDPGVDRALVFAQDRALATWRPVGSALVPEHSLAGHDGQVAAACFAHDGRILTVGVDGTARVWDATTGRLQTVLRGFANELSACAFVDGGKRCLAVTSRELHAFDLRPACGVDLRVGDFRDLHGVALAKGWPGKVLTADSAQRLTIHDDSGQLALEVTEPFALRAGLCVEATGRWLVSTSRSRTRQTVARIYTPALELRQEIPLAMQRPIPTFGPDDQLLVFDRQGDPERACSLFVRGDGAEWQAAPDDVQRSFASVCSGNPALAWHAASASLALATRGAAITLFRWVANPPALHRAESLLPGVDEAHLAAFSADGDRLLLACNDGVVRFVDRRGNLLAAIRGHIGEVCGVAISPDGARLLVAATESGVTVHASDGALLLPIRPRAGGITMASFLPDGRDVLFGTTARSTRIVPIEPATIVDLARGVTRPGMSVDQLANYRRRVGDD